MDRLFHSNWTFWVNTITSLFNFIVAMLFNNLSSFVAGVATTILAVMIWKIDNQIYKDKQRRSK